MSNIMKDVSVRGKMYQAVRDYCREKGVAIGPEVSQWIEDHLDMYETSVQLSIEKPKRLRPRRSKRAIEAEIRKHFTF